MAHEPRPNRWLWVAFLVATALALRSLLRDPTDLAIYLAAADDLAGGHSDLHRPRTGMGPYGYPHFFLLPFVPLRAALPETAIRVLWGVGLGAAAAWLLAGLRRAVGMARGTAGGGMPAWRWAVLLLLFVRCITANLTNAQLSLWVSALMLHGVLAVAGGRDLRGGCLVGTAAALKLTPALLLVLLPLMGRTRAAVLGALTALALVLVLPWPFLGTERHLAHLRDFHAALIEPLWSGVREPEVGTQMGPSASINGTLDWLLQPRPRDAQGRVLAIADLGDAALAVVKAFYAALLAAVAALGFWRAGRLPAAPRILLQASMGMLAMVLFSPLSRTYHLAGILLPAVLFCLCGPRRRDWLWWATAAAFAFATTLRQKWLLGRELWWTLDQVGLLHLGLVGLLAWLAFQLPKSSKAICSFSTPRS